MSEYVSSFGLHPDYEKQIRDPRVEPWFGLVKGLTAEPIFRPLVGELIKVLLKAQHPSLAHFSLPAIEWVEDDGVTNIVGRPLAIPTIPLEPDRFREFSNLSGISPTDRRGLAISLPTVRILNRPSVNLKRFYIVIVSTEDNPVISFSQA